MTLLEACIFDVKDSLLTKQHQTDLENGSYDGGKEPSLPKSRAIQAKKDVSIASQFGNDILHFGISDNPVPKKAVLNDVDDNECNPPNKKQSDTNLFSARLGKVKNDENSFRIKIVSSLNPANKIFSVVSNASGKAKYKVKICNSPSCTCPDFQRYGTRVFCKHLLFALVVFLNIDDNLCKSAVFIGDEDLKIILQREVKPRFLLPVMNIN